MRMLRFGETFRVFQAQFKLVYWLPLRIPLTVSSPGPLFRTCRFRRSPFLGALSEQVSSQALIRSLFVKLPSFMLGALSLCV